MGKLAGCCEYGSWVLGSVNILFWYWSCISEHLCWMIFAHANTFCFIIFPIRLPIADWRVDNEARTIIEKKLLKELEAVKVSIVYMNYNLWHYQVLLFVVYHITTWMKIVSWPSIAETNLKTVLMYVTELLAVRSITLASACILVWLTYTPHV
jgi:hypothetical protein